MRYSQCKDIHKQVKALVREKWIFVNGGKHGKLWTPDHRTWVLVPKTPSDCRSVVNFRMEVRRNREAGLCGLS